MPEKLASVSTSEGTHRLLFNQFSILRLFILAHDNVGRFDPAYFSAKEKWETLTNTLNLSNKFPGELPGYSVLDLHIKHEFLLEVGFELAQQTETSPLSYIAGPSLVSDYLLDDLITVKDTLVEAAEEFPGSFPKDMRPYAFWRYFLGKYAETLFWEFAVWLLKAESGKSTPDLWNFFNTTFLDVKEKLRLEKDLMLDMQHPFELSALKDVLKASLSKPEEIDVIAPYVFYDFSNRAIQLFTLTKPEYVLLVKRFFDTNTFSEVEKRFIDGLAAGPQKYDLVLNFKVDPFINLESRNDPALSFTFAGLHVVAGGEISADKNNNEWLAIATNVELWDPAQAETQMLHQVSDFLNKLQFLSSGVLNWRPRYVKWRPTGAGENIGYGLKRLETPPYNFSEDKKSINLLTEITGGESDLNTRCNRILQFWALARQCVFDDELKFMYLWQIIEIINPKSASLEKLRDTIPVYWLYNRLLKLSPPELDREYEKVQSDFASLYKMRSRGIVHRSMASWEPYSLRLHAQKLEAYVNIFISNLFNLLLSLPASPSREIWEILRKMMDDLHVRKLNQVHVNRFLKAIR